MSDEILIDGRPFPVRELLVTSTVALSQRRIVVPDPGPLSWAAQEEAAEARYIRTKREIADAVEWFGPKRLLVASTRTGRFSARAHLMVHLRRPCGHRGHGDTDPDGCWSNPDLEGVCLGAGSRLRFGELPWRDMPRLQTLCGQGHRTKTPLVAPTAGWAEEFVADTRRRIDIDARRTMRAGICSACAMSAIARKAKAGR